MRKHFLFLCVWRSALHALAAAYAAAAPPPADDEIAVIVNKANDTGSLPRDQVRKIFMGDRGTRPNSKRITVLSRQSGQPEREIVLHQIYKMGDADLNVSQGDPILGDEFLNEAILVRHTPNNGTLTINTLGFYTQPSKQLGSYRPYFCYEKVNAPDRDPIFLDVHRLNGPSVGLRYNLRELAAFKVQYDHRNRRRTPSSDAVSLRLSVAF